ncbi:MAG TPA: Hpt domain-containing protein, partial [Planctomycetota bacterium]|nr:Hpt domain-containing protein [Planctomycetota bacterium]
GDRDILRDIALLFFEDYPKVFSKVRGAIERRDAVEAARAAHTLKGSVSNFSTEVADLILEIERMALGGSVSEADNACILLEKSLVRLKAELVEILREFP